MKTDIRAIQKKLGVAVDGVLGPETLAALKKELGVVTPPQWPTQEQVRSGRSIFGTAGDEAQLCSVVPAYPLLYEGAPVRSIRVHRLVAREVQAALAEVLALRLRAWGSTCTVVVTTTAPHPAAGRSPCMRGELRWISRPRRMPCATRRRVPRFPMRTAAPGGRYGRATVPSPWGVSVIMIGCTCNSPAWAEVSGG